MKKSIIVSVAIVILVSIAMLGCAPSSSPEPAPTTGTDNPLAGVAVKPDGSPYKIANLLPTLCNDYAVGMMNVPKLYIEMAGGEYVSYNPDFDPQAQMAEVEDVITAGVDAIMIVPVDTELMKPSLEAAEAAGIPIFNYEMMMNSDKITYRQEPDSVELGRVCAEEFIKYAKSTGEHYYVYEIWGVMQMAGTQRRHQGLHEVLDQYPDIVTVLESPACDYTPDLAMAAIMDTFPTHPELNAVIEQGSMVQGVVEAFRSLGILHPVGDPNHIPFFGIDDDAGACKAIRDGWCDGVTSHSPHENMDVVTKALLTKVCCGRDIPKEVLIPGHWITIENLDEPDYGAKKIWGEMPLDDFAQWGILDMSHIIETPTADMKLSGY
ncbi:MAG: sugar ABC transporter substrate-binding protein [Dehalococcoidia bacterium]|nr:sugar ABC transporter substrate-binding protein [Dehalococcoidia bacterium]